MYTYNAKVLRVIDGDTLSVELELGFGVTYKTKVRLAGIDTPEIHSVKHNSEEFKRGMEAKSFVEAWVKAEGGEVIITTLKDKKGKYGRYLALIHKRGGGHNLATALRKEGHEK
jgi:micrococcal nuclease